MKVKHLLLFLFVLLLAATCAQADTWYVNTKNGKSLNLRSPVNNAVIGNIPNGTMLETDDTRSTQTAAYVTYGGKSGFVKWGFLSKVPPNGYRQAPAPVPTAIPAAQSNMLPVAGAGDITIQAYGAYIQYTNRSDKYSAVSYDAPVKLKVTADLPRGRTIDYWVIDGVRYDFKSRVPTSFTIDNALDSMIIEAVYKGGQCQTLYTPEIIQMMRTGLPLIVQTKHARLCHVRTDLKGAGGWLSSFDFTQDYQNRATKRLEQGGQITLRVKAIIPSGKKISYWKFNDTKLDFDKTVTEMVVRGLNVSKVYEPVFGTSKKKTTPPTVTNPGDKYRVGTQGCEFTGGGYTGARSGSVAANTKLTFRSDFASGTIAQWTINGTVRKKTVYLVDASNKKHKVKVNDTSKTIVVTVTKDTVVRSYSK